VALNAAVQWEVRTAGADTNGGGFKAGASGSDFSQQDAKRQAPDTTDLSTADAVANGTTTITSGTANFTAAIVGNVIYFAGGTGGITGCWREVTARASATSITIDLLIAASTGMTMNIGGALGTPGVLGSVVVGSNKVWIKTGTYTLSTATPNVSGGPLSLAVSLVRFEGYEITRGDFGARPTIKVPDTGVDTITVITSTSSSATVVANLIVDGNQKASITGIGLGVNGYHSIFRCKVMGTTVKGITMGSGLFSQAILCEVTDFSGTSGMEVATGNLAFGCYVHDGATVAFNIAGGSALHCVADSNSGASSDGFAFATRGVCVGCVAYNNGRDGYRATTQQPGSLVDCIAESNTGWGFNATSSLLTFLLTHCAAYGNGSGAYHTNLPAQYNCLTITAGSVFVDAAGGNFALNSTASQGAALRAAGALGVFPGGTTTGYQDIGAAQHADPAGGGGAVGPWGTIR